MSKLAIKPTQRSRWSRSGKLLLVEEGAARAGPSSTVRVAPVGPQPHVSRSSNSSCLVVTLQPAGQQREKALTRAEFQGFEAGSCLWFCTNISGSGL